MFIDCWLDHFSRSVRSYDSRQTKDVESAEQDAADAVVCPSLFVGGFCVVQHVTYLWVEVGIQGKVVEDNVSYSS